MKNEFGRAFVSRPQSLELSRCVTVERIKASGMLSVCKKWNHGVTKDPDRRAIQEVVHLILKRPKGVQPISPRSARRLAGV
jgi:hypothetical protein